MLHLMVSQNLRNRSFLSFPRRRESSLFKVFWTPACAGVTIWRTFYEFITLGSEDFHFQDIASVEGKGLSHVDRGNELHLVFGIIRHTGKNDRPFDFAGDQNRIAPGAAKGRLFRRNLDSLSILEGCESLEIFGLRDLQVERSWIGLYIEFAGKLVLDPRDLGEIRCNPDAVDDFPPDLNWMSLSFSEHSSISDFPSG